MPASKKRIQVLLRPRLLEPVESIAEDDGTATSAVCVRLIEEALLSRGYDVNTGKQSARPSSTPEGWKNQTVSRNLKSGSTDDLTERDLKMIEILKMLKDV